jgi:hypothetical protein
MWDVILTHIDAISPELKLKVEEVAQPRTLTGPYTEWYRVIIDEATTSEIFPVLGLRFAFY